MRKKIIIHTILYYFKLRNPSEINPGTKLFTEIIICLLFNGVIFYLNASGVIIRRLIMFYSVCNTRYILLFEVTIFSLDTLFPGCQRLHFTSRTLLCVV